MSVTNDYIWAVGRRKEAVARVRIQRGSGKITVNGRELNAYFPIESIQHRILQPFEETGTLGQFDVFVNVQGGGVMGQADAIRHGIARALVKEDAAYRAPLKQSGLLTRDARVKERKKSGQPGARKRFQFSKR